MEQENAYAKPNFPPFIMYVLVHTECIALHTMYLSCREKCPIFVVWKNLHIYIYGAYHLAENAPHLSP
jgi:hypothetical protein